MWGWLWGAPAMRLFRVRGIPVEAHWSLMVAILLNANLLAVTRYLGRYPELSTTTITLMTFASVLLLPVSILLHELGHAFQSHREGAGVERVTLWALGGVAWGGAAQTLAAWGRIVAAGPLVTLLLAGLFGGLGWLGDSLGWPDAVVGIAVLLAQVNAFLLVVNLLPILPLDGGQLLHGALLRRREPAAAAAWMTRVGVGVGLVVLGFGAVGPFLGAWPFSAFPQSVRFNAIVMLQGVFLIWLALSIPPATAAAYHRRWQLTVGDLLPVAAGTQPTVSAEQTIADFLESASVSDGYRTRAFPVRAAGRVAGAVSTGLAERVPPDERSDTTVGDVMLRKADSVVLQRHAPVENAFDALQSHAAHGMVVDGKRVAGILLASDLAEVLLRIRDMERGVGRQADDARIR